MVVDIFRALVVFGKTEYELVDIFLDTTEAVCISLSSQDGSIWSSEAKERVESVLSEAVASIPPALKMEDLEVVTRYGDSRFLTYLSHDSTRLCFIDTILNSQNIEVLRQILTTARFKHKNLLQVHGTPLIQEICTNFVHSNVKSKDVFLHEGCLCLKSEHLTRSLADALSVRTDFEILVWTAQILDVYCRLRYAGLVGCSFAPYELALGPEGEDPRVILTNGKPYFWTDFNKYRQVENVSKTLLENLQGI